MTNLLSKESLPHEISNSRSAYENVSQHSSHNKSISYTSQNSSSNQQVKIRRVPRAHETTHASMLNQATPTSSSHNLGNSGNSKNPTRYVNQVNHSNTTTMVATKTTNKSISLNSSESHSHSNSKSSKSHNSSNFQNKPKISPSSQRVASPTNIIHRSSSNYDNQSQMSSKTKHTNPHVPKTSSYHEIVASSESENVVSLSYKKIVTEIDASRSSQKKISSTSQILDESLASTIKESEMGSLAREISPQSLSEKFSNLEISLPQSESY